MSNKDQSIISAALDKYETEIAELQKRLKQIEDMRGDAKRAGEYWNKYDAERQDHNITKRELAELRAALDASIKLQSHYAASLNMYDGGERRQFKNADEWVLRLKKLKGGNT